MEKRLQQQVASAGIISLCVACHVTPRKLPTDAELLSRFEQHRRAAERIIDRLRVETKVFGVSQDDSGLFFQGFHGRGTPEALDLTYDDLKGYGALMEALHVRSVRSFPRHENYDSSGRRELGFVEFQADMVTSGPWICYKGYSLGKDFNRSNPEVEATDDFLPRGDTTVKAYRRIDGDWFIVIGCVYAPA